MMPLGHVGIPLFVLLFKDDMDFDVRLLVLGGLLPDIIDKPLGHLILPENNGRIFAHTLLFAVMVLISAMIWRRLVPLSLGVSGHLLLDGMFLEPRSALWPLFGGFPSTDYDVIDWIHAYLEPYVIAEEVAGLLIILAVAWRFRLFRWANIRQIFMSGRTASRPNQ